MTPYERYRRDRTGRIVHRADCRTLSPGQGVAWNYADGWTAEQIARIVQQVEWLRACKTCRPSGSERSAPPEAAP